MSGDISKWCQMCGAAPGEPCIVISGGYEGDDGLHPGDERPTPHFYRSATVKPLVAIKDEPDHYLTNYEVVVPENLRDDVQAKFDRWVAEGRNSNEIESLVKSLVLQAFSW